VNVLHHAKQQFSKKNRDFDQYTYRKRRRMYAYWYRKQQSEVDIKKPSTSDVRRVMVAALRRPAGRFSPIFSSLSLSARPPFFDLALQRETRTRTRLESVTRG